MFAEQAKEVSKNGTTTPKLRTACENCRQSKVKCNLSGKSTCTRCLRHGLQCRYGYANRSGKPKGIKNRATLKKMGRLHEGKRPIDRIFGEGSCGLFMVEMTPAITEQRINQVNHGAKSIDENGSLDTRPSQSPSSTTIETPLISNTSTSGTPMMLNGFGGPYPGHIFDLDPIGQLPVGLGCHASPSIQSLQSDPAAEDMTNYHYHALPIPHDLQPTCKCFESQVSYMSQLSQVVSETIEPRSDDSLGKIKSALQACRIFLQCTSCRKDSTNVLLSLSIIELALQLFERWMSHKTQHTGSVRDESILGIHYGHYEVSQEESRRIRNFLIGGLLVRCKEILAMLREAIDTCIIPQQKITAGVGADALFFAQSMFGEATDQPLTSGVSWSPMPGQMSPCMDDGNANGLRQMVTHYDGTVDGLLRLASLDFMQLGVS
ncbi:hypothetical protein MPDQ_003200 [Monascus purpureus]|uniref:Zn(2)-C6 fungal-type domain-containing protein n=1 Tax=Monascus purpureus TaxID=5098 RepID=A0A507QJB0_MONPU|nr:hypothetical protein MPDQ_003200 [Monascus purpureus]